MRSPRLRKKYSDLLVDPLIVSQRADEAMKADKERLEGHPTPTPTEVMSNLKAYLKDAMQGEGKQIKSSNKKFVLSLGEPCAELLKYLEFKSEEGMWIPPRPALQDTIPYSNPLNALLDDVDKELDALMLNQPEEHRRIARLNLRQTPALRDFENLLGYKSFKKDPSNRTVDLTKDEHPFYAGLGAVSELHDDLITFSYRRQIDCDSENTSYYLECYQGIAKGRTSVELETKVTIEISVGRRSLSDVKAAFRAFSLEMDEYMSDEHIIGVFEARLSDSPKQETQLREYLLTIGGYRDSSKIQQVAANSRHTLPEVIGGKDS